MTDMLVKLYELQAGTPLIEQLEAQGIRIRRAMAYEKLPVVAWVQSCFGEAWAGECEVAFSNHPISCYLATRQGEILGFSCYESTCKGFFGPMGVLESERGRGVGKALLLAGLEAMRAAGYAYAIIGGVGPQAFYARAAGAIEIPGSDPGIYPDPLR